MSSLEGLQLQCSKTESSGGDPIKVASQASEHSFLDDYEKCKSKEERGQLLNGDFGDTPSLILVIPLSEAELGIQSLSFSELIDLSPNRFLTGSSIFGCRKSSLS